MPPKVQGVRIALVAPAGVKPPKGFPLASPLREKASRKEHKSMPPKVSKGRPESPLVAPAGANLCHPPTNPQEIGVITHVKR